MLKNKTTLILTSAINLLPVLVGLLMWNALPDKIPTHWNYAGEIDGWSSKLFAVVGLPCFLLAVHWVCAFACFADPKNKNQNGIMMNLVLWICPVVAVMLCSMIYPAAMGVDVAMERIIPAIVGLAFVIIGNYLPKCKPNSTIGIKLPWTLSNEENWNKTHRLGGKVWALCGLALVISAFLPWKNAQAIVFLTALVPAVLIPTVYSYLLYKKTLRQ